MKSTESKTTTATQTQHSGQAPFFQQEASKGVLDGEHQFFGGGRTPFFQPKLTIGAPDDPYEREADATAEKVVQRLAQPDAPALSEPVQSIQRMPTPVQHACAGCEAKEKLQKKEDKEQIQEKIQRKPIFDAPSETVGTIQRKCGDCEQVEQGGVQRQSDGMGQTSTSANFSSQLESSKGGGSALPAEVGAQMGQAMGADFSGVRVHTGSKAAEMSKSIQAQAFTHGSDIYFNEGKYDTGSTDGQKLLAHELTHTVQQGGQGKAIQKLGDLSKIPPNMGCNVAQDQVGETDFVLFVNNSFLLSPTAKMIIINFVNNWHAAGANSLVRIDGFASEVGDDEHNWQLSCNRVTTVMTELVFPSDGSPGIPHSFIDVFVQGETNEFGSAPQNRRVSIYSPQVVDNQPSEMCPSVHCSLPIVLYDDTRDCGGSAADFQNYDKPGGLPIHYFPGFGAIPSWGRMKTLPFETLNDLQLLTLMIYGPDGLNTLAGSEGVRAAIHFYRGSGMPLTHTISDPIGNATNMSAVFNAAVRSIEHNFETAINSMSRISPPAIDCNLLGLTTGRVHNPFPKNPTSSTFFTDLMLKAIIGGTHGIRLTLTSFSIDCTTNQFTATINYHLCDNFGVDETDLYSPSLISFWILQHMRPGHAAYINQIVIDRTFTGRL